MSQLLEFPAQFQVVVNFAVEDNRSVAIIADDGLVSALQVDNFQARGAHGENARAEHSTLIGPAMSQRCRGLLDALRFGRPIFMCKPGYPAQIRTPFASQQNQPSFQPPLPLRLDSRNRALAGYLDYPNATSATPAHTSTTPAQRAALICSPKTYFAPKVPTT